MKIKRPRIFKWMTAASVLSLAILGAQAQTTVLVNAFDSAGEISDDAHAGANPWGNWFGTAFYQVGWDSSDASNNPSSGSMYLQAFYPDSGIGGCCGSQFVLYDGNDGITPSLVGNGGPPNAALATNVEFDVRFDPASFAITNATSTNWPTIEVGTRGTNFGQYDFGTFTLPASQTNWVHVVIPIAPNGVWTSIPNVFFKYFTTAFPTGDAAFLGIYFDNIKFTTSTVAIVPPTMSIQKATPALRVFAGPTQYARTQFATVDTNQSWVGGTYPVTYSFTISGYDVNPTINELHMFLIPLNYDSGGVLNQFTDFSTAANNFRLLMTGGAAGTQTVFANLDWKTNLINANPDHTILAITNDTAIGTWTLTFSNATDGSLTAPGASPAAFNLPADVAAQFANPLVAFLGVQPDPVANIGQHVDFTKFQTAGVASPGVPVNADFTTWSGIDSNLLLTASVSADGSRLVLITTNDAWWVSWTYPDYSSVLGTAPDLSGTVPWKTPFYYNGSNTVFKGNMGPEVWSLIPTTALPTVDGTTNGVKSPSAFFRISNPGPAQ